MRKLAIFSFAFAAAAAVYVYLLPREWIYFALGLLLLLAVVLCFLRFPQAKRLRIAAFGLLTGLFWSFCYEEFRIEPLRALCGESRSITVTVSDYPETTKYGCRVLTEMDGGRMLLYLDENAGLQPGDTLRLSAKVLDVSRGIGEGESLYYSSRDISLLGFQRSKPEMQKAERIPLKYLPTAAAKQVRDSVTRLFAGDTEAFMRALLTGDRSGLSYETRNRMSVVGISHVVAVSGLHVSLIAGVVLLCFRRRK